MALSLILDMSDVFVQDQQIGTKRRRTIASGPGERVTDVDFSIGTSYGIHISRY